jgi:CPA1 family monovalent cation:H+ antiporter
MSAHHAGARRVLYRPAQSGRGRRKRDSSSMTFFESLLLLLLAAIVLLQVARRASLPYPSLLAIAGAVVAFVPGAPKIRMDPETTLALFIAPVLLDAAYDFPLATLRALWRPLLVMVAGVVVATTAVVAFIGWWAAGLPLAAACVLGAIVAPPDAAAAVAVLGAVSMPRSTIGVLKGESLFNDSIALLLFAGAQTVQTKGGLDAATATGLAIAVPGGVLLGIALGYAFRGLNRFVANTLGGNLLQFLNAFLVWILAERLHLSAVLAVVACAMTVAQAPTAVGSPRMRVHSFAVWASVVFLLNVLAFLLMGMQARVILERLPATQLWEAARIATLVTVAVILTRFVVVMGWNRLARLLANGKAARPATLAQGVVTSWSGMRGLVTLATAFALPSDFPQRDVVVLAAFTVVLATLVLQGLTLAPLIRLLKLDRMEDPGRDLADARRRLAQVSLEQMGRAPPGDLTLCEFYTLKADPELAPDGKERLRQYRKLGLQVVGAQRRTLLRLRDDQHIDIDTYYRLQEEIDWRELTLLPDRERRIDEV